MSRWMRALLIATAAAAALALARRVVRRLTASGSRPSASDRPRARSSEDVIGELSDEEREQMLSELGQHV